MGLNRLMKNYLTKRDLDPNIFTIKVDNSYEMSPGCWCQYFGFCEF